LRFIRLFLVGYFILVLGIGLRLWQTDVFSHITPICLASALLWPSVWRSWSRFLGQA